MDGGGRFAPCGEGRQTEEEKGVISERKGENAPADLFFH